MDWNANEHTEPKSFHMAHNLSKQLEQFYNYVCTWMKDSIWSLTHVKSIPIIFTWTNRHQSELFSMTRPFKFRLYWLYWQVTNNMGRRVSFPWKAVSCQLAGIDTIREYMRSDSIRRIYSNNTRQVSIRNSLRVFNPFLSEMNAKILLFKRNPF